MKPGARNTKLLAAVVFGCVALLIVGSGTAVGKSHSPFRRHPPAYTTHGHSNIYARNGEVCFEATWTGSGDWRTNYNSTSSYGNSSETIADKDSWGYGWHLGEVYAGAACAMTVLAGKVGNAGTTFNRGSLQDNATLKDVDTVSNGSGPPTTTTYTCNPGASSTTKVDGLEGSFGAILRHSSIVFEGSVTISPTGCPTGPSVDAPGDTGPGTAVQGAPAILNFFEKDSPTIPVSVFERAKSVSIPFGRSSESRPNCGVTAQPNVNVTCTQTGSWEGTLTLTAVG